MARGYRRDEDIVNSGEKFGEDRLTSCERAFLFDKPEDAVGHAIEKPFHGFFYLPEMETLFRVVAR